MKNLLSVFLALAVVGGFISIGKADLNPTTGTVIRQVFDFASGRNGKFRLDAVNNQFIFGSSAPVTGAVLVSSGTMVVQSTSATSGVKFFRLLNNAGSEVLSVTQGGAINASLAIPLTALTQSGAILNQVVTWNGSNWAPANAAAGDVVKTATQTFSGINTFAGATVLNGSVSVLSTLTVGGYNTGPYQSCYFQDQKAQNTNGGTFTLGAWRTRDLNTEVFDTGSLCSVSANQITLSPGSWRFRATAPAVFVDAHQLRLQNVTDATTAGIGSSLDAHAATSVATVAVIYGRLSTDGSKVFELQHQGQSSQATTGFGKAANFGTEVYAEIEFVKEP